ncbi:GNAT family N-acetyltransferase [Jatrophihabitans sp. YIM 134969]
MKVPSRPPREVVLGPVRLDEGVLTMRTPRLRDATAWSAARLANRRWLERAFPAWGDDWAVEQSPAAWVERWWHLQALRRTVGARPFVILLDGRLIGELGVDAVDTDSGGGEASVWMVRDHGSAAVMNVASLLLIEHVFGGDAPMDRLISPVATTSRKGRTPGLTAVGFAIEATLPRPVGRGEAVDHDMWILHNTPAIRGRAARTLAAVAGTEVGNGAVTDAAPAVNRSAVPDLRAAVPLAPAAARAAVRGGRALVHGATERRKALPAPVRHTDADGVRVAVDGAGIVTSNGTPVGRLALAADVGTSTATLLPRLDAVDAPDAARVLAAAACLLADDVATWAPGVRWVHVRVPTTAAGVADHLAPHRFAHAATFRGNPEGPRRWPGEQLWSREV